MLRLATIAACSIAQRARIVNLGQYPDPPVPNQPLDLQVEQELPEPAITSGTATYSASVNYIPINPDVEDLCSQTACPVAVGFHNETSRSVFPDVKGLVSSKIQWEDQNGDVVWCVQMKWNVQETGDWADEASLDSSSSSSSSSGSGSSSSGSGSGSSSSSSGSGSSTNTGSSSSSGGSSSSSGNSSSSGSSSVNGASVSRGVALRGTAPF